MKIMQLAFSIMLTSTLSGCAYNGYQRGYAGYSSGYGSNYSTGYGVQEVYEYYPAQTYYPLSGGTHYQPRYGSPGYSNRATIHEGHYDNRDRRTANPPDDRQNSRMRDSRTDRWQRHSFRPNGQPQTHAREQRWGAQARNHQDSAGMRQSWQSAPQIPASGGMDRFQRGSSDGRSDAGRGHQSHDRR